MACFSDPSCMTHITHQVLPVSALFPPPPPPPKASTFPSPPPLPSPQSVSCSRCLPVQHIQCTPHCMFGFAHQSGALHLAGEGTLGPAAPSKDEFLQYGVENGGDLSTLAVGLSSCRDGSVKDVTYKVCTCSTRGLHDLIWSVTLHCVL